MAEEIVDPEGSPPPLLPPPSPLKVQTNITNPNIEKLLGDIYGDYKLTQLTIKKCIVVLSDSSCGLMSKAFIAKVGDKLAHNNIIDLNAFLEKLNKIDESLNKAIKFLEWLKLHMVELNNLEEKLKQDTMYSEIGMENGPDDQLMEKLLDKQLAAMKVIPICGAAVGGGVIGGVFGGGVLAGLVTCVSILTAIGVAGVAAGAGVGALVTGAVVGLLVGGLIAGIGIWLVKAYEIGQSRRVLYEQVKEMEEEINMREVPLKLSIINSNLSRMVESVHDHFALRSLPTDLELNRAIQICQNMYKDMREIGRDLPEEKREEMARHAAKRVLESALVSFSFYQDENQIDELIRGIINTERN